MKWITLPAAEYLADQPNLNNPGDTVAANVIPGASSYLPLSATVSYSIALPNTSADDFVRGAISIIGPDGITHTYAGNASRLHELSGTGWNEMVNTASGTGGVYMWNFIPWGSTLIAHKYGNIPYQSATLSAQGNSSFTAMTAAPDARYGDVVRDFVVFGYVREAGIEYPRRIRWSAFNNATDYTQNRGTQSDFQDLQTTGAITGVSGGDFGIIWQEQSITRMTYEGPPTIFRFDAIEKRRGCRIPGSIVRYGNLFFYISEEDLYLFDGTSAKPLGAERYIRKFYSEFDELYRHRVSGIIDPKRRVVMIAYPTTSATGGVPNRILIYNWSVNKFSIADIEAQALFASTGSGYTLETLDNVSTNINNLPLSLDSEIWMGGTQQIAAFNRNHLFYTLEGAAMQGTVETAELRSAPGQRLDITNVRPLVEGGTAATQIGYRDLQTSSVSYTTTATANASGECNVRVAPRFARVRIVANGNWQHIQGADVFLREAGNR